MKKKCIVRSCGTESVVRGVCNKHYHSVYRAIQSGDIWDWAAAARKGLAIASKSKPGPKKKVAK